MADAAMSARLDALLRDVAATLRQAGIESPGREARLLIEQVAGIAGAEILSDPECEIGGEAHDAVMAAAQRRAGGEPLHRILGKRAFYGIELALSPATLEPRPDTEILVDRIIPHVKRIIAERGECKLLDLGTGTGAISLAILAEVDGAIALGVDIEDDAVATALANARSNGLEARFRAMRSDWFSGINEKFHVIVSNPPYISSEEFASLADNVRRFDPETALLGGADGLDAYRAIARSAADYLDEDGLVGIEIGHTQRQAVAAIFANHGYRLIEHARDLAGYDRALLFSTRNGAE